jgi:transposase
MANITIPKKKQTAIGRLVIGGSINIRQTARDLKLSRNTVKRYIKIYSLLACGFDEESISNISQVPVIKSVVVKTDRFNQLVDLLPMLVNLTDGQGILIKELWLKYLTLCPNGYRRSAFNMHFANYLKENKIILRAPRQMFAIPQDDLRILKKWRNSKDRRKWEKAVAILDSFNSKSSRDIASKVERSVDKIKDWIRAYKAQGMQGLEKKQRTPNAHQIIVRKEKRDNLVRLLHESPKIHGINRASWFLADLSATYQKIYGIAISTSSISSYLKKEGYVYRKAREVLTSPDPDFREKMDHIKSILRHLGEKEKFFSVDEFGPFAVKMKGGRSLVKKGERKTFPQIQKSKGFTICTAALELSQNQVTHFFSQKKDTEEIIKLIDLLLIKYSGQEKLYFSWDAASWHASKQLYKYLEDVNGDSYRLEHGTPLIELAPLPASAQFLNVIESVFSGLAKSIIHNSDYSGLDECKTAITQYFKTRNEHFLQHPQKAGNKIWGKELVEPAFSDCNNCKDPKYR